MIVIQVMLYTYILQKVNVSYPIESISVAVVENGTHIPISVENRTDYFQFVAENNTNIQITYQCANAPFFNITNIIALHAVLYPAILCKNVSYMFFDSSSSLGSSNEICYQEVKFQDLHNLSIQSQEACFSDSFVMPQINNYVVYVKTKSVQFQTDRSTTFSRSQLEDTGLTFFPDIYYYSLDDPVIKDENRYFKFSSSDTKQVIILYVFKDGVRLITPMIGAQFVTPRLFIEQLFFNSSLLGPRSGPNTMMVYQVLLSQDLVFQYNTPKFIILPETVVHNGGFDDLSFVNSSSVAFVNKKMFSQFNPDYPIRTFASNIVGQQYQNYQAEGVSFGDGMVMWNMALNVGDQIGLKFPDRFPQSQPQQKKWNVKALLSTWQGSDMIEQPFNIIWNQVNDQDGYGQIQGAVWIE